MKMWNRLLTVVCLLMLAGGVGLGQDKSEVGATSSAQASIGKHYQIVFVVQEVEGGRVINSRRYATDMSFEGVKSGSGSIRTGAKVPIATGSFSSPSGNVPTQFTYVDVGFNADFDNAHLEDDKAYLRLTVELSSSDAAAPNNPIHNPTIRQNRWVAGVTVPLGKPTVVFSSDDLTSKRTMQVELTVTPVK